MWIFSRTTLKNSRSAHRWLVSLFQNGKVGIASKTLRNRVKERQADENRIRLESPRQQTLKDRDTHGALFAKGKTGWSGASTEDCQS